MSERGFPSSAELRERSAVAAGEAMRPFTPLLVCAAAALLIAAGWLFYVAVAEFDRCLELAARV